MSFEPTEEMKAAYRWARLPPDNSLSQALADLAQHAMAAALEWEAKANLPEPSHQGSCIPGITSCDGVCMDRANVFNMTEADWLRLADEKLRK